MTTQSQKFPVQRVPENRPVVIGLVILILTVAILVKISAPIALILCTVAVASLGFYSLFRQFPTGEERESIVQPEMPSRAMDVPEATEEQKKLQEEDLGNVWMLAAIPLVIIPFFLMILLASQ